MREVQVARWKSRQPVMESGWIEYGDEYLEHVLQHHRLELALDWTTVGDRRTGRKLYAYFSSRGEYTGHLLLASYPLSVSIDFDPRKGCNSRRAVWGTTQTMYHHVIGHI